MSSSSALGDEDQMIDITPGNSPSEIYRNPSSSGYNKFSGGNSQERSDMDRTHMPTHSAFGNDDFADPEGK